MDRGCISCSKLVLFLILVIRVYLAYRDANAGVFYNENGIIDLVFFPLIIILTVIAMFIGKKNSRAEGWIYVATFMFIVLFELTTRWEFGKSTRWNSGIFGEDVFQFYAYSAVIVGLFFYLIPGIILIFKRKQQTGQINPPPKQQ